MQRRRQLCRYVLRSNPNIEILSADSLLVDPALLPHSVRVRGGTEEEGKAPWLDEEERREQPLAAPPMMAAKPQQQMGGGGGENLTVQIAGMSKTQLYDIMCQMKNLIEQNPQQARQILIDNPPLTKALFQAQIMLGMVQPPKVMPNIQQPSTQVTQQSQPPSQLQGSQSLTIQPGSQGEYVTKPQVPVRQHQQSQSAISLSSVSIPPLAFQSQAMRETVPPVQQAKGTLSAQLSNQVSSQIHNLPPPPPIPQQSILPTHISMVSGQSQPPLQTSNAMFPPLQPPLPQQPRPSSIQPFQQHLHSQIPTGLGFQVPNPHQQLLSQPLFHAGVNPPSSFPQGLPPLPSQPLPQQIYQGASHITSDFNGSAQVDRASSWATGLPDRSTPFPGPPPLMTGQMGPSPGGQPLRPPQLTPEMEQALLQQVMSLTPEQINQLPPEHRNQVFQIQQIYRR